MKKRIGLHSTPTWSTMARVALVALTIVWAIGTSGTSASSAISGGRNGAASQDQREKSEAERMWTPLGQRERVEGQEVPYPAGARRFRLEAGSLRQSMSRAPREVSGRQTMPMPEVVLPMSDGRLVRFRIEESPLLDPEMARRFPEIRSYRGTALDGSGATMRGDWSPRGFHASVLLNGEMTMIQPTSYSTTTAPDYVSYLYSQSQGGLEGVVCDGTRVVPDGDLSNLTGGSQSASFSAGDTLRTYRIAVATTVEFTNAANLGGGSVAGATAAINTLLNAVNTVYERELAVRFTLVNNTSVIYTAEPDPFTNSDNSAMINQARSTLSTVVGSSNYDLGMVLAATDAGGGLAYVGVVCSTASDSGGAYKGGNASVVLTSGPVTAGLVTVAHEIGHQFAANHTFNANQNACGGSGRSTTSSWEPGSGMTIMSYAGNCSEPIVKIADLRFHGGSLVVMRNYIGGTSCATTSATGNQVPTIAGGADFTIPKNTPFALTATGNDADSGDAANLTYTWEQYNAGGATYISPSYSDAADTSSTTRPIFRPLQATRNNQRVFPSLNYILNNANTPPVTASPPATDLTTGLINGVRPAEYLPQVGRTLNFIATVRDTRGGVATDEVALTVDGGSGPFLVTSPNTATTWAAGTSQTVQWSVNNTNAAPVSCANVRIMLSTDGGITFPIPLASSTANNGTATVTVPGYISTTNARIRVEAVGNIFFDISDANFTITPASGTMAVTALSSLYGATGNTVTLTGTGFTGATSVIFSSNASATFTVNSNTQITATVPAGATTGSIRVVKTGVTDAFSPVFTICSSSPGTLSADDGTYESPFSGLAMWVVRLTPPSYPATLTGVAVRMNGVPVGTTFDVLAGVNANGDTLLDDVTFQSTTTTVSATALTVYPVSPITITSGDFVVGYNYAGAVTSAAALFDTSSASSGRSYYFNGVTYDAAPGNLAVRAQYATGCTLCTVSAAQSASSFPGGGGTRTVTVTAGGSCGWQAGSYSDWITVSSGGSGSGSGTATFSATANGTGSDRTGSVFVGGQVFNFTQASGCSIPIDQTSVAAGTAGSAYSQTLTSTGATAPVNFALASGTLPPGLSISSGGVLSGTPTTSGTYNFTISVTDSTSCTGSRALTLTIACPTITLTSSLPGGTAGTAYSQTVTASPSGGGYSYAVSAGSLPGGLTLNASTGAITGTPTTGGSFTFTITATGFGGCTGSQAYTVSIACPTVTVSPGTLPGGSFGTAYSQTVSAAPSGTSYSFAVSSGALPAGLSLNASTGGISGTPTAGGSFTFTVTATGFGGCTGSQAYTIAVTCPTVTVTPATLPAGAAGTAYSQTVAATPSGGSYSYAVISGSLPAGLSLNASTGVISGTPTSTGTASFTITATGFGSCAGSTSYSLVISCPTITLTPTGLPYAIIGGNYNATVAGSPAGGSYSYAVTSGSLPAGISLNGSTGALTGVATTQGTSNFTITATGFGSCTGSRAYSLLSNDGTVAFYEGDVAPRPNGDGGVNVSDWVQVGRFVIGLDTVTPGSEFQQVDSAPRTTNGDGIINAADWVQTGRYSIGLDPKTNASGSTGAMAPVEGGGERISRLPGGTLRVGEALLERGRVGVVEIMLDAGGHENAVSFTLRFDAGRVDFIDATAAGGRVLLVNDAHAREGRIGMALALPPGERFEPGEQRLITVRLASRDGSDAPVSLYLDDSLATRMMVSPEAEPLDNPQFVGGWVRFVTTPRGVARAGSLKSREMKEIAASGYSPKLLTASTSSSKISKMGRSLVICNRLRILPGRLSSLRRPPELRVVVWRETSSPIPELST